MSYPLGQVFKALRLAQGYTQPELEAQIGVGGGFFSRFENGLNGITLDKLETLMGFYGLNLSSLIMYATNLSDEEVHRAGKGDAAEPTPAPGQSIFPRQDKGGWLQLTETVAVKELAGDTVMVVRSSFEKPSFDLIYRGEVQRGYGNEFEAKKRAAFFAKGVLEAQARAL